MSVLIWRCTQWRTASNYFQSRNRKSVIASCVRSRVSFFIVISGYNFQAVALISKWTRGWLVGMHLTNCRTPEEPFRSEETSVIIIHPFNICIYWSLIFPDLQIRIIFRDQFVIYRYPFHVCCCFSRNLRHLSLFENKDRLPALHNVSAISLTHSISHNEKLYLF